MTSLLAAGAAYGCYAADAAGISGRWSLPYALLGAKSVVIIDLDKQVAVFHPDDQDRFLPLKNLHEGRFVADVGFGETAFQIKRTGRRTATLCQVEEAGRCAKLTALP
ncbi:hypothetical protein [Duganella violaceipulchra]|uniref:Uncharacterized protein n=1 Tax=Duganella violaceipulchra TaxID=2849652 RepID=A0AA41H6Z3_9BURK|nr:hypothetical protein [Duganella violaceicalia]MBV6321614.1 hypothetical protein [Duganella violaceicalia]MCP2008126.1 hypothetical protein [Duganella violaceicalia]